MVLMVMRPVDEACSIAGTRSCGFASKYEMRDAVRDEPAREAKH